MYMYATRLFETAMVVTPLKKLRCVYICVCVCMCVCVYIYI